MAREKRVISIDLGYPPDDRRCGRIEVVLDLEVPIDAGMTPAEAAHKIAIALLKAQGGEAQLARLIARAERGHRAWDRGR